MRDSMLKSTDSEAEFESRDRLNPRAIFGINGKVPFGLHLSKDGQKLVFPIGKKIALADTKSNSMEFISGHSHDVSCLDVGRTGRYIASGQINHMGFRAYIILWNYETLKEISRHDLHKVRVQSLCFTANDKFVVSIGGEDDGTVIVFDIEALSPIVRCVASRNISGVPLYVTALHNNPTFFMVVGDRHLRMWSIVREQKKLNVHDVAVGKYHRRFMGLRIDARDQYAYMGTMSGDIVKVSLNCCDVQNVTKEGHYAAMLGAYGVHISRKPPGRDCARFVNGVRDLAIVGDNMLLIGAGDGCVELVEERKVKENSFKEYPNPTWPMFTSIRKCRLNGAVSGMVQINANEFYVCTEENEIYKLNIKTFTLKLLKTCHSKTVHRIVFPKNMSSVFATAGYETIRIWSVSRLQELLRIMVYNFHCADLIFSADGSSIISVWNDGIIRSFTPISGRLIYAIPNAHNKGCSAVTISSNGRTLVSGGIEGQVRVWKIESLRQSLVATLKDHSGPITSLDMNNKDNEVISASSDGSCVIWDINRLTRIKVMIANTQFMCGRFYPTGVQILTVGSDGVISYWMVYNGSLIRELEGSKKSSVNSISINKSGDYFVTGGNDQIAKLWDYNKGVVLGSGAEHASAIKSTAVAPNSKFFVTGSADGTIIIWDIPEKCWDSIGQPIRQESTSSIKNEKLPPTPPKSNKSSQENITGLVAKTPKDEVCCVECPPIDQKKKPEPKKSCATIPPRIF